MHTFRVVPFLAVAMTVTLEADPGVDIALDVTGLASEPPREMRALVCEANALWQPSGVRLVWVESARSRALPNAALTLDVVRDEAERASAVKDGSQRLGYIVFQNGTGAADRRITLSVRSVQRLVDGVPWSGRRVLGWPPAIREELIGRALGRVLAHEIGHVLLAWRRHTPRGLMRAEFGASQLIDRDRRPFTLPPDLLPRLRAHLQQLTGRATPLMAVE